MTNQECLMNIRAKCRHLIADLQDLEHYVNALEARPVWQTIAREELANTAAAARATLHTVLQKQIQYDNLPIILELTGT